MKQEATAESITVFKYSWWITKDGLREFVVVEIIYTDKRIPEYFRIKEKNIPIPYDVPAKDWSNSIYCGKLIEVI